MRSKINACLQFLLTNVFSAASHKGRPCKWIINACTWDGYLSTPTVDHANNMLVINALHTSAVGAGFIPVLPTTDKILNKFPAAARTGKIVAYH